MADQPSWKTSTLSQAFIVSLGFYCLMLILVADGLIFAKLDLEVAKTIVGWASALEASITSAYLTARKTGSDKANDLPPHPPQ